ncbi:MAG: gamma-glutamyltransferase [Gemmatimonadota bacterium]
MTALALLTKPFRLALVLGLSWSLGAGPALSQADAPLGTPGERPVGFDIPAIHQPVVAHHGMVSSQSELASQAGVEVLKAGGNAVDGAVAVGFALAVTLPAAGNIGGGGFMLIYDPKSRETTSVDFKEKAPGAASRDMFIKPDGSVDRDAINNTRKGVGVPGTVAGLLAAHSRYGKLPLAKVLAPAIRLADEGFVVTDDFSESLGFSEKLLRDPEASKIFYRPDRRPLQPGQKLVQKDLAWSLRQIASGGADAFYKGEIARRIAADQKAHGGLITEKDLADYKAVWRTPVRGEYRGYELQFMPPPSSGGIHIVQILNVLGHYRMKDLGQNSAASLHLMIEAMRQAYADRSAFLGDPDFVKIPTDNLTSKEYGNKTAAEIPLNRARKSSEVRPSGGVPHEGNETTHYSVVDQYGGAVSTTYSLNYGYGTGIVAKGTGILLNNVMDDFSAQAGTPNGYGLVGGDANAIAPGKRPLSSMTPTMIFKDGKPYIVTGSPGGSRIITTVLQQLINTIDYDMNIAEANAAPRIHHQWQPDLVYLEPGINKDTVDILKSMGHLIDDQRVTMGSVQTVMSKGGLFYGSADPRQPGAGAVGY